MGFAGVVGLDYAGVAARLQRRPDLDIDDVWCGLAIMESEMMAAIEEAATAAQEKREQEQRERAQNADFHTAAEARLEN